MKKRTDWGDIGRTIFGVGFGLILLWIILSAVEYNLPLVGLDPPRWLEAISFCQGSGPCSDGSYRASLEEGGWR